jgi:hypothetical protein
MEVTQIMEAIPIMRPIKDNTFMKEINALCLKESK